MNHDKIIAIGLLTLGIFLAAGCIGGEKAEDNVTEDGVDQEEVIAEQIANNTEEATFSKKAIDVINKEIECISEMEKVWSEHDFKINPNQEEISNCSAELRTKTVELEPEGDYKVIYKRIMPMQNACETMCRANLPSDQSTTLLSVTVNVDSKEVKNISARFDLEDELAKAVLGLEKIDDCDKFASRYIENDYIRETKIPFC